MFKGLLSECQVVIIIYVVLERFLSFQVPVSIHSLVIDFQVSSIYTKNAFTAKLTDENNAISFRTDHTSHYNVLVYCNTLISCYLSV